MNINLFSPYEPIASGVVTYTQDLAAALERCGAHVNRVNHRFWSTYRLGLPGVYRWRTAATIDRLVTLAVSPWYQVPRDSAHAVNHFHVSGGFFNHLVVKHYDRVRGRRVITVHDQNFATARIYAPYKDTAQLKMLRDCDLVIVHTAELKQRLEYINPHIETIRHGVYPDRFDIDPAAAKQHVGVAGPIVAQIGFLFNYKGIQNLIKAATQIDATVLIVGSGPDEAEIRELADFLCPGKILFRPHVTDAEFPYYVAASDILVFPRANSQGECSGVLVQAMAAGKAIVAHNMGCFREYLTPDHGILVEPENIAELIAAIKTLLADQALRRQYGRAAQAFALRHLVWDRIAAQHVALFQRWQAT